MSQFFQIHPENPQKRLIAQAASIMQEGGVIVYPTDSCYALGCHIGDKSAIDRIRTIRQVEARHDFTLVCRDLTEVGQYAKLDNQAFRLIKNASPGPFTFILPATAEVPKRLLNKKRKTIGIRIADNLIVQHLLGSLLEPIMSSTLHLPGDEYPLMDPYEMREILEHQVDLVIDGGYCGIEPTTVVNLTEIPALLIRQGKGDASTFIG